MLICKLQRPIFSPADEVLIYDQKRTLNEIVPMTPELRTLFGDRYKIFAEVEVEDGDKLTIGKRVSDRGW